MIKLYGNFISPYVRRSAITMQLHGVPYELVQMMATTQPEVVREQNPMMRIPTLVDEQGRVHVDSWAIVDLIDRRVPSAERTIPDEDPARREVMRVVAHAVGVMEKAQAAYYEHRFHEGEAVNRGWVERSETAVLAGLAWLDGEAATAGDAWLAGTERMSQADVSTAVAFRFVAAVRPELDVSDFPSLVAFSARCEALPAFQACAVPSS